MGLPDDFVPVALRMAEPDLAGDHISMLRKDGTERLHSMTLSPIRDQRGQVTGYVLHVRGRHRGGRRAAGAGRRAGDRAARRRAAARGRPGQGHVRLLGQPRAAHPDHEHRRLPRDAAGGRVRRAVRATSATPSAGSTPTANGCFADRRAAHAGPDPGGQGRGRPSRSTCARSRGRRTTWWRPRGPSATLTPSCRCPTARSPVAGNRELLERMLVNLVGNAVKFTPDGGEVALRLVDRPRRRGADGERQRDRDPRGGAAAPLHPVLPVEPGPTQRDPGQRARALARPGGRRGARRDAPGRQRAGRGRDASRCGSRSRTSGICKIQLRLQPVTPEEVLRCPPSPSTT